MMKEKTIWQLGFKVIGAHFSAVLVNLIVVLLFVSLVDNIVMRVIIGIVVFAIYAMVLGACVWTFGNEDITKVKFKKIKEDKNRGLKIGFIATIPMFVMAIFLLLTKAGVFPNIVFLFYRLLNAHTLLPIILINESTSISSVSWLEVFGMISFLLITPLTSWACYIIGYKDIVIMDKVMYKNKKKKR